MTTELQKKKWTNMFNMFDVNGDGKIEQADLNQFHKRLFETSDIAPGSPRYEELNGRFAGFGQALQQATQKETVMLDDWLAFLTNVISSEETYQLVRPISKAIFSLWDMNGDGKVSINEYRKLYTVMRLGEGYADEIFAKLDLNQDGHITTDELMKLSDDYFVGDDPNAPGNLFFGPI